jgi:hypothetical protein
VKKSKKKKVKLMKFNFNFLLLFLKKRFFEKKSRPLAQKMLISSFSRRVLAFSGEGRPWRRRRDGRADGVKHHPIYAKKNKNERRRTLSSRGSFRSTITAFGCPDRARH